MERQGWKAIIYDAPWARFKTGQTGVIVSEDRRSCETTYDDKSSIIVEADSNISFENRENGHILFKQKGSDLFDIVCLYQKAGGTYELAVDDVTIDGCVGKDYASFIRDLNIYEIENGNRKKVVGYEKIKSMVVKPTATESFKNITDSVVTIPIIVSNRGATATGEAILMPNSQQHEEYIDTVINGFNTSDVTMSCDSPGTYYCTMYKDYDNLNGCHGGKVKFAINKGVTSDPTYTIDFSNVAVTLNYNIIKCGEIIGTTSYTDTASYVIAPKQGVSVINSSSNSIKASIADGVRSITIVMTTAYKGIKQEITLPIEEPCTNSAQ